MFPERRSPAAPTTRRYAGLQRATLALAIASCFCGVAQAAEVPGAVLEQAEARMKAGDPASAFALLSPLEAEHAGESRFDYLLGISAFDAGHVTRAIFALERLVAEQPDNSLAHAELGRAYLAAGEKDSADAQFQQARSGRMPEGAAAAIDRVLGAIEQPKAPGRAVVRGYIDLTAGHDSNLNSATTAGEIALPAFGGLTFTLDPTSRQRGAAFFATGAGADMQVPLSGPWSLIGAVNGRRTFNNGNNDLNQQQADGSLGLAWTRDANTVSAQLQTSTFWLGGNRYRSADGASAQWQHALGSQAQVSTFGQWSRLTYPGQENRNADRSVLGVGYARSFAQSVIAYGSVYGAREDVRASGFDNFGQHAIGLRAGGEYHSGKAIWFAALQYEGRHYSGPEPFFDTTRRDHQTDLSLGVHFRIASDWRFTPQVISTRSASNVGLYDYRRTIVQLTLRREFN